MLKIFTNQCPGGEKGVCVCVCVWGGGGVGGRGWVEGGGVISSKRKRGCAAVWNLSN